MPKELRGRRYLTAANQWVADAISNELPYFDYAETCAWYNVFQNRCGVPASRPSSATGLTSPPQRWCFSSTRGWWVYSCRSPRSLTGGIGYWPCRCEQARVLDRDHRLGGDRSGRRTPIT